MYKAIDKKGTGKTSRLILLAKETGATLVCIRKDYVEDLLRRYGITGVRYLTRTEYLDEVLRGDVVGKTYLIDELDSLLQCMSIIGYSNTEE